MGCVDASDNVAHSTVRCYKFVFWHAGGRSNHGVLAIAVACVRGEFESCPVYGLIVEAIIIMCCFPSRTAITG